MTPPLGVMYLDAILKDNGISSKIMFTSQCRDNFAFMRTVGEIESAISDETVCVGFSVMTGPQINASLKIAEYLKRKHPRIKTVWGGVHPTLIPQQTVEHPLVDIVCHGESENSFIDIVRNLKAKKELPEIFYSKGVFDLNFLPFLRYEDIKREKFYSGRSPFYKFTTPKVASIELTRGCPLSCYYCVQNNMRTKFRYMAVDNVIKHLRHLKSFGYEAVIVADDNFYISPISKDVLKAIEKEKFGFQMYISIPVTKIVKMTEDDFRLLERVGIGVLGISVEAGSDRMLKIMGKKHTVEMAHEANRILSNYRFISNYNYIAGFPEETLDDIKGTLESMMLMLHQNRRASVNIKKLIPTPNTDVYRSCVENGMQEPERLEDWYKVVDLDWNGFYDFVDKDVQAFYKSQKPYIEKIKNFCLRSCSWKDR